MGFVEKRGENRYRARTRDPSTGHERSKTFRRKGDAKRWLDQAEADKVSGVWVDPGQARRRFSEWIDDYLAISVHLKPKTFESYESVLRVHVRDRFGNAQIGSIDRVAIQRWVADLTRAGHSPAVIHQAVGAARRVFAMAVEAGAIKINPCQKINTPSIESKEMIFLEPVQVRDLADAMDPLYRTLVLTAAYTGMRAGELSALRVDRIDFLRRKLEVTQSATEAGGRWTLGPPKNGKSRSLSLPESLLELLSIEVDGQEPSSYVFRSPNGGLLRHSNFYRTYFKPAVLACAGVPDALRFHDLRHTCVAFLIAKGAHPRAIMERLGHSSVQVSLDRYGHLFPSLDDELVDGLEELYRGSRAACARPEPASAPVSALWVSDKNTA